MIVVDASFVSDYLLLSGSRFDIADIVAVQDSVAAPDLLEYEVANVLRRHNILGALTDDGAAIAFQAFRQMGVNLFEPGLLEVRAWELRYNMTFYDACYVALAEMLKCPLFTSDRKLASALGHQADIVLI